MMDKDNRPRNFFDWIGVSSTPDWTKSRLLGGFFGIVLVILILLAVASGLHVLTSVFREPSGGVGSLGVGALIVAILGAPFVIWNTWIKHRALNFQKEGHITDRINKAVEQLGAEKKVDKIGRSVKILTGKSKRHLIFGRLDEPAPTQPLSIVVSRRQKTIVNETGTFTEDGWDYEIRTWEQEKTVIEWAGQSLLISDSEQIVDTGEWKVFSESLPNIEVRIGALLSLERIAQDSTSYDRGRDHVRVMEIICTYIRENSPARTAKGQDFDDWEPLTDRATDKERSSHLEKRAERFDTWHMSGKAHDWVKTLLPPREDIGLALRILGRRSAEQRLVEAQWRSTATEKSHWVFDIPCPIPPERMSEEDFLEAKPDSFAAKAQAWRAALLAYDGYRLDLRKTNLQRADLSGLVLAGARLDGARLEGADLSDARIEGASLYETRLDAAILFDTRLEGAILNRARLEGALFWNAAMRGTVLREARLEGVHLRGALMEFADLRNARMEAAVFLTARMAGASLSGARVEGATFVKVSMEGADIRSLRTDVSTNFSDVSLQNALIGSTDFSFTSLSSDQFGTMFGDGSVMLPGSVDKDHPDWPAHWPRGKLEAFELLEQYRRWLSDPTTYIPPSPREPVAPPP